MVNEEKKTVSRRTVAKGAAWSLPVVATAVAAPAASASTNCTTPPAPTVEGNCPLIGVGAAPSFEICNPSSSPDCPDGAPIAAGTTGTIEFDSLVGLDVGSLIGSGTGASTIELLGTNGTTVSFQLVSDLAPGACLTIPFLTGGLLAAIVNRTATLTFQGSSDSFSFSGVGALGVFAFECLI